MLQRVYDLVGPEEAEKIRKSLDGPGKRIVALPKDAPPECKPLLLQAGFKQHRGAPGLFVIGKVALDRQSGETCRLEQQPKAVLPKSTAVPSVGLFEPHCSDQPVKVPKPPLLSTDFTGYVDRLRERGVAPNSINLARRMMADTAQTVDRANRFVQELWSAMDHPDSGLGPADIQSIYDHIKYQQTIAMSLLGSRGFDSLSDGRFSMAVTIIQRRSALIQRDVADLVAKAVTDEPFDEAFMAEQPNWPHHVTTRNILQNLFQYIDQLDFEGEMKRMPEDSPTRRSLEQGMSLDANGVRSFFRDMRDRLTPSIQRLGSDHERLWFEQFLASLEHELELLLESSSTTIGAPINIRSVIVTLFRIWIALNMVSPCVWGDVSNSRARSSSGASQVPWKASHRLWPSPT